MIPSVPVSWGELVDKITILEIKAEQLSSESSRANVRRELERLPAIWTPVAKDHPEIGSHKAALKHANQTMGQIEEDIGGKEAEKNFEDPVIRLAHGNHRD